MLIKVNIVNICTQLKIVLNLIAINENFVYSFVTSTKISRNNRTWIRLTKMTSYTVTCLDIQWVFFTFNWWFIFTASHFSLLVHSRGADSNHNKKYFTFIDIQIQNFIICNYSVRSIFQAFIFKITVVAWIFRMIHNYSNTWLINHKT